VTLITGPAFGPEGELMSRAQAGGYKVVVVEELQRDIHLWRDWKSLRRIEDLLAEISPKIVHTHSSKAGILGRWAAHRLGLIKIVHTIHGLAFHEYETGWRNKLYVSLEKKAARWSHALISVADAMTTKALAAGIGTPEQYTTIYSGMDIEPFLTRPAGADAFRASLNLPSDAVLITQVSRLAELKGHEFILQTAEKLNDSRIHFCFVGDGNLRKKIETEITERNLSERFHLTGLLPPEQISAVMHATDVLIHCSLREGLARALPQAMLAGRPVISFDIDGAREVVNEETGILVPREDVNGLVEAIGRLTRNPDRRFLLGSGGREACKTRFDHRYMVERIEGLYEGLVHHHPQ
jgi:glycosyltransferase involved in cell wall biosynthesis